jgi:alpha/beta superfamily hydrolase
VGGRSRLLALVTTALLLGGCGESDEPPRPAAQPREIGGCLREGEGVRFIEFEGVQAAVAGDGPIGIVTLSGGDGYICQWQEYARELADQGARVLMFDDYTDDPIADALSAAGWLRDDGAQAVSLIGTSIGGSVAVHAAAEDPDAVAAVVTLSAVREPDRLVGNVMPAARRLTVPALHAGSREDGYTDFGRDTRALHRATGSGVKQRLLVRGGDHGLEILTRDVKARILEFLQVAS